MYLARTDSDPFPLRYNVSAIALQGETPLTPKIKNHSHYKIKVVSKMDIKKMGADMLIEKMTKAVENGELPSMPLQGKSPVDEYNELSEDEKNHYKNLFESGEYEKNISATNYKENRLISGMILSSANHAKTEEESNKFDKWWSDLMNMIRKITTDE